MHKLPTSGERILLRARLTAWEEKERKEKRKEMKKKGRRDYFGRKRKTGNASSLARLPQPVARLDPGTENS